MYSNEIECVIAEYLKNPKAEYAVMIDGEWGLSVMCWRCYDAHHSGTVLSEDKRSLFVVNVADIHIESFDCHGIVFFYRT